MNYAGFAESPYHALAQKYLGGKPPSLLTFGVKGGFQAGKDFYDALGLIKRLVNIGDAKSLACHPASTTHRQMPEAEQRKAGVHAGNDPPLHRHRAQRRHHRRSGSGAGRRACRNRKPRAVRSVTVVQSFAFRGPRRRARYGAYRPGQQHAGCGVARDGIAIRAAVERGAPASLDVRLTFFSFAEIARSEQARSRMEGTYADAGHPAGRPGRPDRHRRRTDWRAICAMNPIGRWRMLTDWAETDTISTVFSCLAAHAAVLHLDGIARQPLAAETERCVRVSARRRRSLFFNIPPDVRCPILAIMMWPRTSCGARATASFRA